MNVPVDVHAVATDGSGAFALATPLRVRDILSLAVREAIGARAPADKFARSLHRTLTGLVAGDYTLIVNGRRCVDADAVVVCDRTADVRFFVTARRRTQAFHENVM